MKKTICGVELNLFKNKPEPEEVAGIVRNWDIRQQADFIGWWGSLNRSANNLDWAPSFVQKIEELDAENQDGSGMEFLKALSDALIEYEKGRAHVK